LGRICTIIGLNPMPAHSGQEAAYYRRATLKYVLALSLVAALSISACLLIQRMISYHHSSAAIVNAAGKRRYTSQQVAFHAFRMATTRNDETRARSRSTLERALERFEQNHRGLLQGDPSLNLPGTLSERMRSLYFGEPRPLAPLVDRFTFLAREILGASPGELKPELPALVELVELATGPLIGRLDDSVRLYQEESEDWTDSLQNAELAILLATLTLLIVEALFIFRPMLRSISKLVDERTRQLRETQAVVLSQQEKVLASARLSALGEMAAGVGHEISNALTILNDLCGRLESAVEARPIDSAGLRQISASLGRTTERIALVLRGLRSVSRDAYKDPFTQVRVAELLNDTLSFCRERFRRGGVDLQVEALDPSWSFQGRGVEMSQVILNLLNNAFDAASRQDQKWVRVGVAPEGARLAIQVTDSGPGVPPDLRDSIFRPFFTTKEAGKGTGIGLSISLGIVRRHGGELSLDPSCPNTRFVVTVPTADA
jgi:signal transduction histidine kinase